MADLFAFIVILIVALLVAVAVGRRVGGGMFGRLLVVGVLARAIGCEARLLVLEKVYNGVGDAKGYLGWGEVYAAHLRALDFGPIMEPSTGASWWGTHFVRVISGVVQVFVGYNFHANSLVFSLFGYAGLVLMASSVRRYFGDARGNTYFAWLVLWPSLWYWPSSMGKDTLMILGVGLFVFGYSARARIRWRYVALGALLTTLIRPHITMALVAALALGEWAGRRATAKEVPAGRLAAVLLVALALFYSSLSQFGLGAADIEGIQEQFEMYAERTRQGGSQIAAVTGPLAIPMAFVNVLFRPFPWEAHHVFALASGAEMWGIWLYFIVQREQLRFAFSKWRSYRILRIALFTTLFISLLYGLAFANLGIIARQRVIILPFLFIPMALKRLGSDAPRRILGTGPSEPAPG